jgi:hypothetical protein
MSGSSKMLSRKLTCMKLGFATLSMVEHEERFDFVGIVVL